MLLFHTTSPWRAIQIALSGTFVAHPSSGDRGLNCFPDNRDPGAQILSGEGAMLSFMWEGPVERSDALDRAGILVDQLPHRMFLATGTDAGLQLVGLTVHGGREAWNQAASELLPSSRLLSWLGASGWYTTRRANELMAQVERRVAARPPIRIIAPRTRDEARLHS